MKLLNELKMKYKNEKLETNLNNNVFKYMKKV